MGLVNSDNNWKSLVGFVNRHFSDRENFPEGGTFTFVAAHDRFIRPTSIVPLNRLSELSFGENANPFLGMTIFPAVGTSGIDSSIYYGLRTGGFGGDGSEETRTIWDSIVGVPRLSDVLEVGFGGEYSVAGECWLAYRYVEPKSVKELSQTFIQFIERLQTGDPSPS